MPVRTKKDIRASLARRKEKARELREKIERLGITIVDKDSSIAVGEYWYVRSLDETEKLPQALKHFKKKFGYLPSHIRTDKDGLGSVSVSMWHVKMLPEKNGVLRYAKVKSQRQMEKAAKAANRTSRLRRSPSRGKGAGSKPKRIHKKMPGNER